MPSVSCALSPHPDFPCRVLGKLQAEVARPAPDRLRIVYRLSGVSPDLVLPRAETGRADELWRHTCLEAFVRVPGQQGYRELNLSPGGAWAAYRFDDYRQGMVDAEVGSPAVSASRLADDVLELTADWTLDLPPGAAWQIAVASVIEASDGAVSYWSLRHPQGRPDFHHPDGFVLELPPPSAV